MTRPEAPPLPTHDTVARHAPLRDPAVLDWIAGRVRRARGLGDGEPASFAFPRTPVALLHRAGETVVAKLHPELSQLAKNAVHHRYLAARGLPVPRLLSWSRAAPARAWLTLEEYVDGPTLDDLPAAERASGLARIAHTLSALHAWQRRTRGWIGLPRRGAYALAYLPHALKRAGRLCKSPQEMGEFLARYFEREGASRRDFERAEPFYACDFLLRITRKRADRALREGLRDPGAIREEARARLELCLDLLRPDGPRFHQTPVPFSSPQT